MGKMIASHQYIRLIFGLKIKQLRRQRGMSFKELAASTGMSISYLNEIEKGKKYPKTDKIMILAESLEVSYDQLVSLKLNKKLAPIASLFKSGVLDSLPLEMFGIEPGTLIELIVQAPAKLNAFINTLFRIARNYEMGEASFFSAALRSYQEMHDNYFEEIETSVDQFLEQLHLSSNESLKPADLETFLTEQHGYTINRKSLAEHNELSRFRSVFAPKSKELYINKEVSEAQEIFLLGKEVGFNCLELMKERPLLSNSFPVNSFEEVLHSFKASYFASALIINRHRLQEDLEAFLDRKEWDPQAFLDMMASYKGASPEMFLQRLTQLLPRYFGINNLFFIRMHDKLDSKRNRFTITKELHLSQMHLPHGNELQEHYCRRWVSVGTLTELSQMQQNDHPDSLNIAAQISSYINSQKEYLCISVARPNAPTPNSNVSVTLGIPLDSQNKKKIRFWKSESILTRTVHTTCERCPITDCAERAAPPVLAEEKEKQQLIDEKLRELLE